MPTPVAADSTKPSPDPVPPWNERLFRPRWLLLAASLSTLPVLGPWVIRQLPELEVRPEYRLPFSQIQLEPPVPMHLPADFLDQVRVQALLDEQVSVLDADLPRRLAEAFSKHPWVEHVESVHNIFPATITVELRYRHPAALVAVPDGFYAVDGDGVLLPPSDFRADAMAKYIWIDGIHSTPQGAAGRPWGDARVVAAAQLAEFLGVRWKTLGLSAIIAPVDSSPEANIEDLIFEFRTNGGSTILWGRVPGNSHPGELSANQKLGRMEKYIAEFGSFDKPQGPYEIDIRHWQEISRRPLTDPYANTARLREPGSRR